MRYLILAIALICSIQSNAQDIKKAASLQSEAQNLYEDKQYATALTKINQAIAQFKGAGKGVPDATNALKKSIEAKIAENKRRQNEIAERQDFEYYYSQASTQYDNDDFEAALSLINQALEYFPNDSQAKSLKGLILKKINAAENESVLLSAKSAFDSGDFREALRLYREAYNNDKYSVEYSQISALQSQITTYDGAVKLAQKAFNSQNYPLAISELERAQKQMALESDAANLYKQATFRNEMKLGDKAFELKNYEEAQSHYELAQKNTSNSTEESEAKAKWSNSGYAYHIGLAKKYQESNDLYKSILELLAAGMIKELNAEDLEFQNTVLNKFETQMWETQSPEDYLEIYENGKYAAQAKQKILLAHMYDGDYFRDIHIYRKSIAAFEEAKKYADYRTLAIIDKKIDQTYRWRDYGGEYSFNFNLDMPIGLNSTNFVSQKQYSMLYYGPNLFLPVNGSANFSHRSMSVIAPVSAEVTFNAPLRINYIPPIQIVGGAFFSSNKGYNLSKIESANDTAFYDIGDTPIPGMGQITQIDTLSYVMNMNAYRFNRFGFKVGISAFNIVTIYVPFQKINLDVQVDAPCLDCTTEQIHVGRFAAGLGVELKYALGDFTFLGFWENWNAVFNHVKSQNVLYTDGRAGASVFSPNAFSRNMGLQVGYNIGDGFVLNLRYENPMVRGYFQSISGQSDLRKFSQNLLKIRLTYTLGL
jgi:tetratricopeptide (TPR) repeat protein